MDAFDEEILNFWRSLQEFNVKYIMVGGYATNLHGYQRFTGDLDIWLKDDLVNRRALRKAFVKCNIGDYPMIDYMHLHPAGRSLHIINVAFITHVEFPPPYCPCYHSEEVKINICTIKCTKSILLTGTRLLNLTLITTIKT